MTPRAYRRVTLEVTAISGPLAQHTAPCPKCRTDRATFGRRGRRLVFWCRTCAVHFVRDHDPDDDCAIWPRESPTERPVMPLRPWEQA